MTTHWRPSDVMLAQRATSNLPVARERDGVRPSPNRYYWDHAPVLGSDGVRATRFGGELWIALSARRSRRPERRHERARLRLLTRQNSTWHDEGNLLPDGFSPGSREWAGMATLDHADRLTLYYTAAGNAGESAASYAQRIFAATALLANSAGKPVLSAWRDLGEIVRADGTRYLPADEADGLPGTIRAFRDPFYFNDPADTTAYLLFSASDARATSDKNGLLGMATATKSGWVLQDPILKAEGVTNEMERPHVVHHAGRYYLFWSTHGWTIAPELNAPTGLYGMVADAIMGPYRPLNGNGLVAANPPEQPYQAYSWFVLNDLTVVSFTDMLDGVIEPQPTSPHYPVGKFEGSFAPEFRIALDGATSRIWTEHR